MVTGMKANLLIILLIVNINIARPKNGMKEIFGWQQLEFDYASQADKEADIESGFYKPDDVPAPIDVEVQYKDDLNHRVFVTIPRFIKGVPITIGTITNKTINGNPVIAPYPDWSWHRTIAPPCNPTRIISAYRIKIDECGRLWILDAGRNGGKVFCPPQIMAFDIDTDTLLHSYELPPDQYAKSSIFVTTAVEVLGPENNCENTFVYAADCKNNALVVYDHARQRSWKIIHRSFNPLSTFSKYRIEGEEFKLTDGLMGLDLSPNFPYCERKLFYHALSSNRENWVFTYILRNESMFADDPMAFPNAFHTYEGTRPSQSAAMALDKNGIAFFGNMNDTTIMCWNTIYPFGGNNLDIVDKNKDELQFPSGVKIITNLKGRQELWAVTAAFQKLINNRLSAKEHNFRIMAGGVNKLLRGTRCLNGGKKNIDQIRRGFDEEVQYIEDRKLINDMDQDL